MIDNLFNCFWPGQGICGQEMQAGMLPRVCLATGVGKVKDEFIKIFFLIHELSKCDLFHHAQSHPFVSLCFLFVVLFCLFVFVFCLFVCLFLFFFVFFLFCWVFFVAFFFFFFLGGGSSFIRFITSAYIFNKQIKQI